MIDKNYSISKDKDEVIPFGYSSARDLSFNKTDILDSLIAHDAPKEVQKPKTEKPKAQTVDPRREEIIRLTSVYNEKKLSQQRAIRTRWILTYCAFVLVAFIAIMISMGNLTIEDILQTSVQQFGLALLLAIVLSAIHFVINLSIFGWLIQKIIAADRELDPITKKIQELEKSLNN